MALGQGNGLSPLPFYAYWRAKGLFPLPPLNTCFKGGGERTRAWGIYKLRQASSFDPPPAGPP